MSIWVGGFEMDASLEETHEHEAEITEHPVERGADVTDNIRNKPIRLTLRACVSDSPIGAIAARRAVGSTPSREAYEHLKAIRKARQPVTIIAELTTYEMMALESLRIPRNEETGDALDWEATFRQIEIVDNTRTAVRVSTPRAKGKVDKGHKAVEPAPTQAPEPRMPTAARIFSRTGK